MRTGSGKLSDNKFVLIIIAAVVAVLFLLNFVLSIAGTGNSDYLTEDDRLTSTITHSDGSHTAYNGINLPALESDEILSINVPLDKEDYINNASLCFHWENAVCKVYSGNVVIYTYGKTRSDRHRQIGDVLCSVQIPDDAWGSSLTIVFQQKEGSYSIEPQSIRIMPTISALKYPLYGHGLEFFVFTAMGVLGTLGIIVIILMRKHINALCLFWLPLLCVIASIWAFGSFRFFYVFVENTVFCSVIEYIALLLIPIPMMALIRTLDISPGINYLSSFAVGVFVIWFLFATLNHTSMEIHYSLFPMPTVVIIAIVLLVLLIMLFAIPRQKRTARSNALMYSIALTFALSLLSVMATTVSMSELQLKGQIFKCFSHCFIYTLVFVTILLFSLIYMIQYIREKKAAEKKEQLDEIAYRDALTGLHNRQFCLREFHSIESSRLPDFTVFFYDADGLKKTNDIYGHDKGDELIRTVASAINAFCENYDDSFCGRWGGDEFIVCIKGDDVDGEAAIKEFQQELETAAQKKSFPFSVTVSCGFCHSSLSDPFVPGDAIEEADKRMYESKKKRKESQSAETN
jgi:diguanylate cyclase (GGDEF)-like protein